MREIIEKIEELELIEQLKIAISCLNNVIYNARYNLETEEEEKDFKELEKISNQIFDIILKNGGFKDEK